MSGITAGQAHRTLRIIRADQRLRFQSGSIHVSWLGLKLLSLRGFVPSCDIVTEGHKSGFRLVQIVRVFCPTTKAALMTCAPRIGLVFM